LCIDRRIVHDTPPIRPKPIGTWYAYVFNLITLSRHNCSELWFSHGKANDPKAAVKNTGIS
jgi:hypothetical protein